MKSIRKIIFLSFLLIGIKGFAVGTLDPRPFVLSVQTTNIGTSTDLQFKIPTRKDLIYNYDVDCENDGSYEFTNQTGDVLCTYNKSGIKTIKIRGSFPAIYLNGVGDTQKVLDVLQWGDIVWESMESAFKGATNLSISASDNPYLSQVFTMRYMFQGATQLSFTYSINDWDVSNVTSMYGLFYLAENFNNDITGWEVSNVTNMAYMFSQAKIFNQSLGKWDVSHVQDMTGMFKGAEVFNQKIGDWNVSQVRKMSHMFESALKFNQSIVKWDVSQVDDSYYGMRYMFAGATNFNQDIGNWNVSQVVNMEGMFYQASSFNQDISGWDISQVQNMQWMFKQGHTISIAHYDALLRKWHTLNLQNNVTFHAGITSNYCQNEAEKLKIEFSNGWIFDDAGLNCNFYIITPDEVTVKSGETFVINVNANIDEGVGTYHTIVGGADADKFTMNLYGELQFKITPDVNLPTDQNGDNIYRVLVRADNNGPEDYQTIKVKVVSNSNPTLAPIIMYLLN
jgi:surface protein